MTVKALGAGNPFDERIAFHPGVVGPDHPGLGEGHPPALNEHCWPVIGRSGSIGRRSPGPASAGSLFLKRGRAGVKTGGGQFCKWVPSGQGWEYLGFLWGHWRS